MAAVTAAATLPLVTARVLSDFVHERITLTAAGFIA